MTNRTPSEIAEEITENMDYIPYFCKTKGKDMLPVLQDMIAQAIEAERSAMRVVPDSFKAVADSEDNESSSYPYWMVFDPETIREGDVDGVAMSMVGPFFSRETATNYLKRRRYAYSDKALVWCASAYYSKDFQKLYDDSKALKSQRTISEHVLREVEEALEFYGSYSTYKNNVGKKYSPSLGLDVPHGPVWSAIGKDKGTAAQKALKALRDAVGDRK